MRMSESLIDSFKDIVFFKDMAGVYLECNPAFASFLDRSKEAIIGKTDYDLFEHGQADFFRQNDLQMLEQRQPRHNEEWVTYPDGSRHLLDTLKTPYFGDDGSVIGVLGVSRDITERYRMETALRESEENFHRFFDTIDDLIVVLTPEGRIVFTNVALQTKLAYTREELLTMHVLDLHAKTDLEKGEAIFGEMLRHERASCPLPLVTKGGILFPTETRIWLGKWNGQDCIFGISKDLTIEQEAKQRFELLFRNNPNPMALSTLPERKFIDVNDAFLRTLGYSKPEVIGTTSSDLGLFANVDDYERITSRLAAEHRISEIDVQVRTKAGAVRNGLFWGEVLQSQTSSFLLTVFLDITEQRKVSAALSRESERLQGIIRGTNVGTWEWNIQTGETIFNERWASMAGYTLEELAPLTIQSWIDLTHPEDLQLSTAALQRHFTGELDSYEVEVRMRHKSGHWIWVLDRGQVIERAAHGEPLWMMGTHQEITARKQAEAEIARLSNLQRELMQLATEFVNVPTDRQDASINISLETMGRLIQADRAYLFAYDLNASH
jgi:PAS domain S-box-containing protein